MRAAWVFGLLLLVVLPHNRCRAALVCDGRNTIANVTLTLDVGFFSMAAWVYAYDLNNDYPGIVASDASTLTVQLTGPAYSIYGNQNKALFYIKLPGVVNPSPQLVSRTLRPGVWFHVAVANNRSDLSLFLDGQLQESRPSPTKGRSLLIDKLMIGAACGGFSDCVLHGLLVDVALWNVPLSEKQVHQAMCGNVGAVPPYAYWPAKETSGNVLHDTVGTQNAQVFHGAWMNASPPGCHAIDWNQ